MLRYVWLLLWCHYVVDSTYDDLKDLRGVPVLKNDAECNKYYLEIVKYYFAKTNIVPKDTEDIEYCKINEPVRLESRAISDYWEYFDTDLDRIIDYYSSLPHVVTTVNTDVANPVVTTGVIEVSSSSQVPLFITANILYRHTTGDRGRNYSPEVARQMQLMGQLDTDERGHLLALSLGGGNGPMNFIPMARNLNRHFRSRQIFSHWRHTEQTILRFLQDNRNGRVSWRIAMRYPNNILLDPSAYHSFRPDDITLQYTTYADQNSDNSVRYRSPQISFLNDNNFACTYMNTWFDELRRRLMSAPDDSIRKRCLSQTNLPQPRGVMGQETSNGYWKQRYRVGFPFTISGRHYFYGQSIIDGTNWFIQELLPDGQMGQETDHGYWSYRYSVSFPFSINGKHFFYGQGTQGYNWFIQELYPGGKMGGETWHGSWNQRYAVGFPFSIGGRQYFYAQSIVDGTNWFIQELLPGGQMGGETDHGYWKFNYAVAFPFSINGRQFFYGQNTNNGYWFIQELLWGGKMGAETSNGWNANKYVVAFPFSMGGKQYYYAQNIEDGSDWYIRELLPGGRMGVVTDHGVWNNKYAVSFPFSINGRQFFYGSGSTTSYWFVQELL